MKLHAIHRPQFWRTRFVAALVVPLVASSLAHAVDGTWMGASSTEWTDPTNWTSNPVVPDGTATFTNTGQTLVENNFFVSIGAIQFTAAPNAQAFTINNLNDFFIVNGAGVFNNSTNTQSFNNNSTILFLNSSTASGGPGAVVYNNSGTINFLNSSTVGTAQIANNGVVEFFDTSTAAGSQITNNATMDFFDSASAATANITNSASGILTFNNTSTAATSSIGNAGTLNFTNAATAGSAAITNTGAVTFSNTSSAGTSASTLINNGTGTISFLDASTAGAATIQNNSFSSTTFGVIGGTDTATAGTAIIANTNFGALRFNASTSAAFATITNNISTTTTFADSSTAGSATIGNQSSGSVSFLNNATAGNATITNTGPFTNVFFSDASSAGASRINNNFGAVTFGTGGGTDTATASTATITNTAGGATNFNALTTADGATLNNQAGTVRFADGSSGGTARYIGATGSTFDISALTVAGMTIGSLEGGGTFSLGGKALTVGGNNLSTSVTGIINGTGGALVKTGTGTLTLSGANIYTGTTTVNGGGLAVNGSIAASSLTTVNAGGTLSGTGSVGNTTVAGGTFAPGNGTPGSSMTVTGSLMVQSAATYLVQINPTTSSSATVSGAATLGGGTVSANFAAGSYVQKQYTILTAGSVSGGFNGVANANLPAGFVTSLSYDPTHAYLNLTLNLNPPMPPMPPAPGTPIYLPLNGNQANVANALVGFFNSTGGIPIVFGTLTPAGLTQLSGEGVTASQQTTFDAASQFLGLMTDPFLGGRNDNAATGGASGYADEADALAYAGKIRSAPRDAFGALYRKAPPLTVYEPRWSTWAAGFGGGQTTDGNASIGSNTATSRIYAAAAGADYRISPNTLVGFALAGGGTSFRVETLGTGRSDLFQAGVFMRHTAGAAYIAAAAAYGWQDVTTERTLTIAGIDRLRAEFNANAYSGRVEGGYRLVSPLPGWGLTPYAAGQATSFDLPNYSERAVAGANTFALNYVARTADASRSELGFRSDKSVAWDRAILTLRGRAAWAHNFDIDRSVQATFQTLPGASFLVGGARPARDAALTTASAEVRWMNGWSAAASFEGEFSDVTRSYAGKGIVRYAW